VAHPLCQATESPTEGTAVLVVHRLGDSRAQGVLWPAEAPELPCEIKHCQRDATTRLAPLELKAVHPLAKSPVLTDFGQTVIESGAIFDYLICFHGFAGPHCRPATEPCQTPR
jgi:glutathione S-transferase